MSEQEGLISQLRKAASVGDAAALEQALVGGADAREGESWALSLAAARGHEECVRLLIPVSDPKSRDSYALKAASAGGHEECVRLLISVSDPLANGSFALIWAAGPGIEECVGLLIPVSDSKAQGWQALAVGARGGHVECVKLLMPVSDKLTEAAALAREIGHLEVAGMIEAFMEAKTLSEAIQNSSLSSRIKSVL